MRAKFGSMNGTNHHHLELSTKLIMSRKCYGNFSQRFVVAKKFMYSDGE